MATQFLRYQKAFLLTTAAQNIHIFPRKSPLHKKHFFEWLKTANFSTACGTVTLKSPLSRAFSVPDVHPRPRKRLARCTLDCGFKTPESPALRGFVAGPWALATAALYLVLKSNGLPRPKIRLKKFGFSSKSVPANIAKKLPLQLRPKPLFIAFFNFSHKRPTFAFTSESGYTLGFRRKMAHSGLHAETGGVSDGGGITTLGAFRTFTNIPGPGVRTAYFAALGSWSGGALEERRKPSGQRCAYACRCPEGVAAPLGCVIFFAFVEIGICTSGAHGFPRVRGMGGITTLGALCVLLKYRTAACQSGSFAVFLRPLFTFAKDPAG